MLLDIILPENWHFPLITAAPLPSVAASNPYPISERRRRGGRYQAVRRLLRSSLSTANRASGVCTAISSCQEYLCEPVRFGCFSRDGRSEARGSLGLSHWYVPALSVCPHLPHELWLTESLYVHLPVSCSSRTEARCYALATTPRTA